MQAVMQQVDAAIHASRSARRALQHAGLVLAHAAEEARMVPEAATGVDGSGAASTAVATRARRHSGDGESESFSAAQEQRALVQVHLTVIKEQS